MKERNKKVYINKLGLENGHNAIKRMFFDVEPCFENDEELMGFSFGLFREYLKKCGMNSPLTLYMLRNDNTAQYIFNDSKSVNISMKLPVHMVKKTVKECFEYDDYILVVETSKNHFTVVTQM